MYEAIKQRAVLGLKQDSTLWTTSLFHSMNNAHTYRLYIKSRIWLRNFGEPLSYRLIRLTPMSEKLPQKHGVLSFDGIGVTC